MSNMGTPVVMLDLYPSIIPELVIVDVIPGARSSSFSDVPEYDTNIIPTSDFRHIRVPSHLFCSFAGKGFEIAEDAPFHINHVLSTLFQYLKIPPSSPRQFQDIGDKNQRSILIRQGFRIQGFGEVWVLELVEFNDGWTDLYYHMEIKCYPILLRIRCTSISSYVKGNYQAVDWKEQDGVMDSIDEDTAIDSNSA
jgi:hypothetical protein